MYVLDADSIKQSRITLSLIIINSFCFITFNIILPIEYILTLVQINSNIINGNHPRVFISLDSLNKYLGEYADKMLY